MFDSLERHSALRNKAHDMQRLGNILLEHYRCEGLSDLLEVVAQLFRASTDLVIISDPASIPTALTLQGDALLTRYELYYDLDALEKSIQCFNRALSRPSTNPTRLLDETKIALAYALFCRFEAFSCHADCETALNILKTAREHSSGNDSANEAWNLTITALVMTRRSVRAVMNPSLEEIEDVWTSLRKLPRAALLSHSRYTQSLLAEVYLSRELFEKTSSQENLLQGLKIADQVLLLRTQEAPVMRYHVEIALFGLHNMIYVHNRGNALWHKHLTIALDIADRMRKAPLSNWHPDSRWRSLHCWTMASIERCDQEEDLDGMEHAIKLLHEVVTLCPKSHISRPLMVSHLSATLGFYFYQSGRLSALDALINLRNLHADYLLRTPYLASNISEAMLSRAQIADIMSARLLIKEVIHLCLNRKNEPGFGLTR
jgi:tetratricopeptide (TPR) repeat protein